MVFDRVDAVKGEGREERRADDRLSHGGHLGRVLVAEQVGRPAVIPQSLKRRVERNRQGPVGAGVDTVVVGPGAVGSDAAVVERTHEQPIAIRADVDALRTNLDTRAAPAAARRTVHVELADLVAVSRRSRPDLARHPCKSGFR